MQALYAGCIVLSGLALVAITLMIPAGVFMRYVMNDPLQWPEPASVIMMVFFSFIGGAAVYRANAQIAVEALMKAVGARSRAAMQWGVHACMLLIAAFMLGYGVQLCLITRGNTIAEFPWLSVGIVYLPIPIAGLLTLLFLVEKAWLGEPPRTDVMYRDQAVELE
jgi:TRAP-type C4-dicarboxylate transport system permease small subunit